MGGSFPGAHTTPRRALRVVADDLSGATESLAAALACFPEALRPRGEVHLKPPATGDYDPAYWHGLDLDTRTVAAAEAARRYAAIAGHPDAALFCVTALKVDSLLRGNVCAAAGAFAPCAQRPVVLAPALPAQGRSTVNGRIQLPEGGTAVGTLEGSQREVLAAADVPAGVVPLAAVRRGVPALRQSIDELAGQGRVAAVDAVTEADLDTVAAASLASPTAVLIGASGLIGAAGRCLLQETCSIRPVETITPPCAAAPNSEGVLVVAGTAEPQVQAQLDALTTAGMPVEHQRPGEPAEAVLQRMNQQLCAGVVALRTPSFVHRPQDSAAILHDIAGLAREFLLRNPRIAAVLTGGATARAVLDEMGVRTLRLLCRTHAGAAHLQTSSGRQIITRPGSHGGATNLLDLVRHLGAPPSNVLAESSPTAAFAQKEGM